MEWRFEEGLDRTEVRAPDPALPRLAAQSMIAGILGTFLFGLLHLEVLTLLCVALAFGGFFGMLVLGTVVRPEMAIRITPTEVHLTRGRPWGRHLVGDLDTVLVEVGPRPERSSAGMVVGTLYVGGRTVRLGTVPSADLERLVALIEARAPAASTRIGDGEAEIPEALRTAARQGADTRSQRAVRHPDTGMG